MKTKSNNQPAFTGSDVGLLATKSVIMSKRIQYAIANRVCGIFTCVGIKSDVFFSGIVAKNIGMKTALEEVLKAKIVAPEFDPQLVGALGVAVLANIYVSRV